MNPLILVAAAAAASIAFFRSEATRPRRRGARWTLGVAVALAVLGVVPLMGIPGAVVYELSAPWVELLVGSGFRGLGDGAWPAALVITLTWPSSLVLTHALAQGPLHRRSRWLKAALWIALPYAAGILLALWAHQSAA